MLKPLFIILLCFFSSLQACFAKEEIRVQIFSAHKKIEKIWLKGSFSFISPFKRPVKNKTYKLNCKNGQIYLADKSIFSSKLVLQGSQIQITLSNGLSQVYSNLVFINAKANCELSLQNLIDIKTYIMGVVASEMPANWPLEALKAQSVLAQTRLNKQNIILDSTSEQAYKGLQNITPKIQKAVQETWKQKLFYKGKLIRAFYHSTCGGQISSGEYLKENYPYLTFQKCLYCTNSPFSKNKQSFIPNLKILQKDQAKRPIKVQFNNQIMSGYAFWIYYGQSFGWDKIPSTYYWVQNNFVYSRGAGHGVGLCQWGAKGLAEKGKNYKQILNYYFPHTYLTYSPP